MSNELTKSLENAGAYCARRAVVAYRFLAPQPGDELAGAAKGAALIERVEHSFNNELRIGLRILLASLIVVGGWASLVPLAGAVVAGGAVIVETNVKKVQHATGGVVSRILVHDGMHVNEGDTVARLDETQTRANLQILTQQLDQIRMRIARLIAERDGAAEPVTPEKLAARSNDDDVRQLIASEKSVFQARASSRQSQKELLRNEIRQLHDKASSVAMQIKSKTTQSELIVGELKGVRALFDKKLVPLTRLTALQRDAARLDGEREELSSSGAQMQSKISETELNIVRIDQDFLNDVLKDLRQSLDKEAELTERSIGAQDQLDRLDIHAPASGAVHELALHTVGGVIAPGEVMMEVVPDTEELQIEARLAPNQIDQVHLGQKGRVRFSAFQQNSTPQFDGVVSYVSADLTHDKQSNASYYTIRVTLSDQRHRLENLHLVSGMPTEVFLETGSRTMLSYLLKPIEDQLKRSMSEP